jgi:hypothetical protein
VAAQEIERQEERRNPLIGIAAIIARISPPEGEQPLRIVDGGTETTTLDRAAQNVVFEEIPEEVETARAPLEYGPARTSRGAISRTFGSARGRADR